MAETAVQERWIYAAFCNCGGAVVLMAESYAKSPEGSREVAKFLRDGLRLDRMIWPEAKEERPALGHVPACPKYPEQQERREAQRLRGVAQREARNG